MLSLIVAVAKNGVIGKDNQLLWHLPKDLQYFKQLTDGHIIVMGRRTFESLPKLLPNRTHWVITGQRDYKPLYDGARLFFSLEEVERALEGKKEAFVIGGAQIYEQFIHKANRLYITEIDRDFEGDAVFPPIPDTFKKVSITEGERDEKHPWPYRFVVYEKADTP